MAPPDILLLILDTARADAFAPWGGSDPSPTLERLCAEGMWWDQAIAPAPWTLPSTASVLTGLLPSEHRIDARAIGWRGALPTSPAPAVRAYAGRWLPEALAARGYRTWAVSCNPWFSTWGGFARGFDRFVDVRPPWARQPRTRAGWGVRRIREMVVADHGGRRALEHVGREIARRGPRPVFGVVNLMETHAPYDPPFKEHPIHQVRGPRARASMLYRQLRQSGFHLRPDEPYLRTIRACYRAAARVTDRLAGAVLRAFLSDPSRPAVVVVLSDHGENLGEHGLFEHHSSLHETLLRVPLVAWGRGVDLAAGPSSEPVSLVSIASWVEDVADGDVRPIGGDRPVLAEYESSRLHLQVPREFRALAARSGPQALPALVLHPGLAVRVGTTKYVATGDGGEQLFDLSTDPGEEHDLLADSPGLAEPFRPAREGWLARIGGASGGAPEPVAMGEPAEGEIAAHLRRLGYID